METESEINPSDTNINPLDKKKRIVNYALTIYTTSTRYCSFGCEYFG